MKPVDQLGMGPKRELALLPSGNFMITVTPPTFMNMKANSVILTPDQHRRFTSWLKGESLMQDALPDLSPADREILITGIGDEDFKKMVNEDEEEE